MSKTTTTLRRAFDVQCRIISEADGLVDYVASNETLDSYDEVISAKGWRFTRFAKNAPFVDSHDYDSIKKLLGRVESATISGRDLTERVRWAKDVEENALAKLGWKMTLGGFLKAVSVGFFPVRSVRNGADGWNAAVTELNIPQEAAAKIRWIYLEQEQIELSACIIGANPDALAKSFAAGCVKDADLASVGFRDEDMTFLSVAGKALESGTISEIERVLIVREMSRITGQEPISGRTKHHTSNSPGKPGGGEIAERQAAERKAFLEKLNQVLTH